MYRSLSRAARVVVFAFLASTTMAAVPKGGPQYQSDTRTVGFLRRHLVSGGDIQYPLEAARLKQQGSGFYLMKLRLDGSVDSVSVKGSTGYKALDENVTRTLRGYRFKAKTEGPLLWLVAFLKPATVMVKVHRWDEKNPPRLPRHEQATRRL